MLKIKDDVDMSIFVEKYGFKPEYDINTGELKELYRINGYYWGGNKKERKTTTISKEQNKSGKFNKEGRFKAFWNIFVEDRKFTNFTPSGNYYLSLDDEDYEILYDLIQAGLVEKVR